MASIARKQHVSEPTVRKYLRMDDLSEKPPVRKRRGSVADPYLPLICVCSIEVRPMRHNFPVRKSGRN